MPNCEVWGKHSRPRAATLTRWARLRLRYGQIDGAINASLPSPGWFNGDFNYDGVVDILDYGVIDGTINTQGAAFPTGDGSLSAVAVPEPTAIMILLPALLPLGHRRRRAAKV